MDTQEKLPFGTPVSAEPDNRTAQEIETDLLAKKFEEQASNVPPEETAAKLWTLYWPLYRSAVNNMSNKQMRRVMKALIEVPLNSKEYKLMSKEEKQVFAIGTNLLEAKWQMMLHTLSKHHQKILDDEAAKAVAPQETPVLEVKQENNEVIENGKS